MQTFCELVPDFYRYLSKEGNCSSGAIINYMSWLRFLDSIYHITTDLTEEEIERIMDCEKQAQLTRNKYTKPRDLTNFSTSLRKFHKFLKSDMMSAINSLWETDKKIEKEIEISKTLTAGEKETIIKSRIGQGQFKRLLLNYWKTCAVTGLYKQDLLIASHIKPWRNADNKERIDLYNGLLLTPNLDKLFDLGYVSFDEKGHILISHLLFKDEFELLSITNDMTLRKYENSHESYMKYHRQNIYLG